MFFELLIYPMWGKKKYKNYLGLLVKKLRYSGLQVEMRMGKDNWLPNCFCNIIIRNSIIWDIYTDMYKNITYLYVSVVERWLWPQISEILWGPPAPVGVAIGSTPCRSQQRRTKRLNNYTRELRKTIKTNTSYLDKEYINRTNSSTDCNTILRRMSTVAHYFKQILSIYYHIKTLISYHSTSYKWFHILRLQNVIVLYISKHLGSIYKGYIYMTTCVYLTK